MPITHCGACIIDYAERNTVKEQKIIKKMRILKASEKKHKYAPRGAVLT